MGKKLQKYLDEAEKTEQQIAELEERLRTIRAAQKKEEDSEIIRAIRSTKMGGRELLALLDNIQAGNVTSMMLRKIGNTAAAVMRIRSNTAL